MQEKTVTPAMQPLSDAGWKHTVDGRWNRWTSPAEDAGVRFDAFAAQHPSQNLATLDHLGGHDPDRPAWAVTASSVSGHVRNVQDWLDRARQACDAGRRG
ncbi:hypothetical protein ACWCQM_15490 [Streptomyces sp. NPDC002125]